MKRALLALTLALGACGSPQGKISSSYLKESPVDGSKFYSFNMKDIDGHEVSLSKYKGKVLLVVNVASKCGNTPQYKGLEESYQKLNSQGFEVLGFPANNFGGQEPGTEKEIKEFCSLSYGVKFPMFAKISVKGDDMHPLYKYLTSETGFDGDIGWNFGKFLVNREGKVIARFSPKAHVESAEIMDVIQAALK